MENKMSQLPDTNSMQHFENLQPSSNGSKLNIPSNTPLPNNTSLNTEQFNGQLPQFNGQLPQFNVQHPQFNVQHPQFNAQYQQYMMQQQSAGSSSSFSLSNIINFGKKHMYLIAGIILLGVLGYYLYTKKYKNKNQEKTTPNVVQQPLNQIQQQPQFDLDYNNRRELENTEIEIDDKELDQNLTQEEMEEIQRQLQQSQHNNSRQQLM